MKKFYPMYTPPLMGTCSNCKGTCRRDTPNEDWYHSATNKFMCFAKPKSSGEYVMCAVPISSTIHKGKMPERDGRYRTDEQRERAA